MNKIEAGTKIIITTPWASETEYKKGDIFTVEVVSPPGVYVEINGNREYLASDEFEAYTEPEFKVGDRVQITIPDGDTDTFGGWFFVSGTGTVQEPEYQPLESSLIRVQADVTHPEHGNGSAWNIDKKYVTPVVAEPEPEPLAEWEKELLNVTPRAIAFEDIQEGDLIKAEYTTNGIKMVREGVVKNLLGTRSPYWFNVENGLVADSGWDATYTLLERPEPPKPNPFAEAKVGSVATSNEGTRYIWVKESEQGWRAYSVGGDYRSSHPTSDEALRADSTMKITYNAP